MAAYFQVLAAGTSKITHPQPRWVNYFSFSTGNEVLSGCLPVFKNEGQAPGQVRELLGAMCIDLNIIVPIETLRTMDCWSAFWNQVTTETQTCTPYSLTEAELERLRAAIAPEAVCGSSLPASESCAEDWQGRQTRGYIASPECAGPQAGAGSGVSARYVYMGERSEEEKSSIMTTFLIICACGGVAVWIQRNRQRDQSPVAQARARARAQAPVRSAAFVRLTRQLMRGCCTGWRPESESDISHTRDGRVPARGAGRCRASRAGRRREPRTVCGRGWRGSTRAVPIRQLHRYYVSLCKAHFPQPTLPASENAAWSAGIRLGAPSDSRPHRRCRTNLFTMISVPVLRVLSKEEWILSKEE